MAPPKPLNLGIAFSLLRRWEDSTRCFHNAKEAERYNAVFWEWFGDDCFQARMYDIAIEAFKNAKSSESISMLEVRRVVMKIGRAYEHKGDLEKAIRMYEKGFGLVGFSPRDSIWSIVRLGRAYAAKREHETEIELYEKLVEIEPKAWWAWQYLWEAYQITGDTGGAVKAYERAVKDNPFIVLYTSDPSQNSKACTRGAP
jgi:tetratricopeptide (TPR) repeat protein